MGAISTVSTLPLARGGAVKSNHFAAAPLEAASFLQSERNFLRSLPCSPLASASLEHSSEAALWTIGALVSVFAAGVVVCANAEPTSSMDAKAVASAREDMVVMGAPQVKEAHRRAAMLNSG